MLRSVRFSVVLKMELFKGNFEFLEQHDIDPHKCGVDIITSKIKEMEIGDGSRWNSLPKKLIVNIKLNLCRCRLRFVRLHNKIQSPKCKDLHPLRNRCMFVRGGLVTFNGRRVGPKLLLFNL